MKLAASFGRVVPQRPGHRKRHSEIVEPDWTIAVSHSEAYWDRALPEARALVDEIELPADAVQAMEATPHLGTVAEPISVAEAKQLAEAARAAVVEALGKLSKPTAEAAWKLDGLLTNFDETAALSVEDIAEAVRTILSQFEPTPFESIAQAHYVVLTRRLNGFEEPESILCAPSMRREMWMLLHSNAAPRDALWHQQHEVSIAGEPKFMGIPIVWSDAE